MKFLILGALELLLLSLQSSLLAPLGHTFPVRPDLLLLLVISWSLAFGRAQGMVAAALAGLLSDTVSAMPLGSHLVAMVPVLLLLVAAELEIVESRFAVTLVLAVLGTVGYYLTLALVLQLSGWQRDWAGSFAWVLAPSALVNLALAPLFFWGTTFLAARFGDTRRSAAFGQPS